MRDRRPLALMLLAGLTFGSLLVTGGYAWYLRSESYRNSCAAYLSEALELPADIGEVVPRSHDSREFRNVRIWLPERVGEAAFVRQAVLTRTPTDTDPTAYELSLRGGNCEISTRTWLREHYRFVLESGLRPGFDPAGPRRVEFSGMDLTFEHDQFRAALADASGVVAFDDPQLGRAHVTCRRFNGQSVPKPVTLSAEFTPQETGIRLALVQLTVPELPLALLGLEGLAPLGLHSGSFSGQMVYRETLAGRELVARGKTVDVQLGECTTGWFERPWRGVAPEVELQELSVVDGVPVRLRFRGLIRDAVLGDVLAPWGLGDVGGSVSLDVHEAVLSQAGVDCFVASGHCRGVVLDQISEAVGWGRMSGVANIEIGDLTIVQNQVESLDVEITVDSARDAPHWVERELLATVIEQALGISLPDALLSVAPERIEYADLGVRLEVRDEELYVLGVPGPRENELVFIRVPPLPWFGIPEPEGPFDLHASLDELRKRVRERVEERLDALGADVSPGATEGLADPGPTSPITE
jgi:hypothetical protein